MGDASEEWQAVRDVSVGDVVGSYDPVTGQWMCGRYDATHAGGVQPTVKTDHITINKAVRIMKQARCASERAARAGAAY